MEKFNNLCVYCGKTKSCSPGTDKEICSDPKKFLDCRTKAPTKAPIVPTDKPTLAPVVPSTAAPTAPVKVNCPDSKAWSVCPKQNKKNCMKKFNNLCVYCGKTKSCSPGTDKE